MPAKTPAKAGKGFTLGAKKALDTYDLVVPSGETCRVRRPGVQGLMGMNLLDNFDQLTALIQTEHFDRVDSEMGRKKREIEQIKTFAENKDAVMSSLDMVDKVCVGVIIDPRVLPVPRYTEGHPQAGEEIPAAERDADAVYIDYVDLDDRLFIMQFAVGGTADVAKFLAERDQYMGDVSTE